MEQISFFLEKFKTLGLENVAIKQAFIEQIKSVFHTTLASNDVTVKDGTVYVRAHPTLKSELYIKRELLLTKLSSILGPTKITNLR